MSTRDPRVIDGHVLCEPDYQAAKRDPQLLANAVAFPPRMAPSAPVRQQVVITGIDVSFSDLLNFLTKAGLAAIPAAIIISVVVTAIAVVFAALVGLL